MSEKLTFNSLKSGPGARKAGKRVGRGIGSGLGKTAGRGHKGQHSRSGGYHKVGFEGGQMPMQRRVPKFGFNSLKARLTDQVCLSELNLVESDTVDLLSLKKAGVIAGHVTKAKIILSGELKSAKTIVGIACTKGAKAAIESLGGKVEA